MFGGSVVIVNSASVRGVSDGYFRPEKPSKCNIHSHRPASKKNPPAPAKKNIKKKVVTTP